MTTNLPQNNTVNRVQEHFMHLRTSLLSMYRDSKSASHTVVTGSLREAFVRSVLQGHLPANTSWSSGQMVGHAPETELSGQLDLMLHSGELPQLYIHDGFIRLVPSDACISVIEVKSEITTGKATNPKPTDSLSGAMSALRASKAVARFVDVGASNKKPVPFHIFGFVSRIKAETVLKAIYDNLSFHNNSSSEQWPESIVILEGPSNSEPDGYGYFKHGQSIKFPQSAQDATLPGVIPNLKVTKVLGWEALAIAVSILANEAAAFPSNHFRLERYIFG